MTRVVTSLELPHSLTGTEPIGIRKDMTSLVQMYQQSPGINSLTDHALEELFDNPECIDCVVAYDKSANGRHLEGFAQYIIEPEYDFAQINNLFVDETGRGKGTGRALLAKIIAEATDQGVHEIDVHATEESVGFYQKLGFVLDPDDPSEFPHMIKRLNDNT